MDTNIRFPSVAYMKQYISEILFEGLCCTLGTLQVIAMKRDVVDITETVREKLQMSDKVMSCMRTGSTREGLRLMESDTDSMHWFKDQRVIWDSSQIRSSNISRIAWILGDCSNCVPGYALLQILYEINNRVISIACIEVNGNTYISSSIYKHITSCLYFRGTLNGPCARSCIGPMQIDKAFCFVSDFWPPSASSWVRRCHTWPPSHVVHRCHFVAKGHKQGNHEDLEWRISFSVAERKIVYSMNHCQFLTYGLLKLFLKEVINKGFSENDKLLCSYHMKTAIFWLIQQNSISNWCPQNLLECFNVCFKCILKWVYEGVCPNFFIPENNMFLGKINGRVQKSLFRRLYDLYQSTATKLKSICHIPLLNFYLRIILVNDPFLLFCTKEELLISEDDFQFDVVLFCEIAANGAEISDVKEYKDNFKAIEQLITLPMSQYSIVMFQKITSSIFQKTAFYLRYVCKCNNKRSYIIDKFQCNILKLAAKFGFISDSLYFAMYYYKTFRILKCLSVLDKIKIKLEKQLLMYNGQVNSEIHMYAIGKQSWSSKMKNVAMDVVLFNEIVYLKELAPEQLSALQNSRPILVIPPFVLFHMLKIFCNRQVDTGKTYDVLKKLENRVHHDKVFRIPSTLKDISFQILGICQQVTGNLEDAFYSYQTSLQYFPLNGLKYATLVRICTVINELFEKKKARKKNE